MGVYIKDMKMPKGCRDCRFEDWGKCIAIRPIGTTRHLSEEREVYCPLIEVKEPHGRLIDAEVLSLALDLYKTAKGKDAHVEIEEMEKAVDAMKTEIEGSE